MNTPEDATTAVSTVTEARDGVLNLAASEMTANDVLEAAMDDFERVVREDERARLRAFGALSASPSRDVALRASASAVLAYVEEINTNLAPDERIRTHFKWREGSGSRAVALFAALRAALTSEPSSR